jgi:hypothetical protein
MTNLETAVREALEPVMEQDSWTFCVRCGAFKHGLAEHTCRTHPLELPGMESDDKRRAKSYAID